MLTGPAAGIVTVHHETGPWTLCLACEARRDFDLSELHDFERVCERDPANDPTHQPASDAEWAEVRGMIEDVSTL